MLAAALASCSIEVACDIRRPAARPDGGGPDVLRRRRARRPTTSSGSSGRWRIRGARIPPRHRRPVDAARSRRGWRLRIRPGAAGARLTSGAAISLRPGWPRCGSGGAAVAITGEGRLDSQTPRQGARRGRRSSAMRFGIPCIAIAGTVVDPHRPGVPATLSLAAMDPTVDPKRHPRALLRSAARQAVRRPQLLDAKVHLRIHARLDAVSSSGRYSSPTNPSYPR